MESKGKFIKNKQDHLIQYKWNIKWFLGGCEGLVNWGSDCVKSWCLFFHCDNCWNLRGHVAWAHIGNAP